MSDKIEKSEEEWRSQLSEEEYRVTRQAGTEPAFSGKFYKNKETGTYHCVCCGGALFSSVEKYDSGSGWPSFWKPIGSSNLTIHQDSTHGMVRTEVRCPTCDAHLGHVFEDGPQPTGQRYCINSLSLKFSDDKSE